VSNSKIKFAEDITRFLRMFSGIAAYADEVGKVGMTEQAAAEAEARLQRAKTAFGDFEAQRQKIIAEAETAAEEVRVAAKKKDADAALAREDILRGARREAAGITASATASVEGLHARAKAEYDHTIGTLEQARAARAQHVAELNSTRAEHTKLIDDIRRSKVRLDEINAEIAAVRKRLG
jgi:chromosome segregation ATPase